MLPGHCIKHGLFYHFAIQIKEVLNEGFLLLSRMGSDNNSTATVKRKSTSDCYCSQHLLEKKMKETKHSHRGNIFKRHSCSSNWITRPTVTNVQMLCFALLLLLTGFPDSQFIRYSYAQDSPDISPAESSSNATVDTTEEMVTGNNGPTPVEDESPGGDVGSESTTPSPAEPTQAPPTEAPPTEPPVTDPCAGVTCANGGTCDVTVENKVYCACVSGWMGANCTDGK